MVRTLNFHCRGSGSVLGQGVKILQAMGCRQKKQTKKKQKKNLLFFRSQYRYFNPSTQH